MTAPPLSPRRAALDLLQAVLARHRPLDEALEAHAGLAELDPRDRALVRNLAATSLRRLGQIDALIRHCLERRLPPRARPVRDVLRLGVCQLLFLDIPDHAAIDTAVRLADAPYRKLVNAVLRRLQREGADLLAAQDAARLNTPDWLWESWCDAYGEATTRAIAEAHLREPPLDISVKAEAETWAAKLDADLLPTGSLRRLAGGRVTDLPGFDAGAWWVQDAAAALPAKLLGDVAGKQVIDLCAAPGGKTAQLAAAGARVTAVERSAKRMERLRRNLDRLGLAAETVVADAAAWRPETPVDAVLLDVPCSSTGTLRRHPDVAWLKGPDDVAKLAGVQANLLAAALDMVKPGGTVVYCSCSLQPEEGPQQVAGRDRLPIGPEEVGGLADLVTPDGDLRCLPCHLGDRGGLDGFFAARLRRAG